MKASANFRQFVQELETEKDLVVINEEVDPHLEIAAITRLAYERHAPAPLFDNIRGRQDKGLFRILGAPVGVGSGCNPLRRIAKSVGLPSGASAFDIVQRLSQARSSPPIDPVQVASGPVKSNKLFGDSINLERLPVRLHHEQDGGKYLQTFGMFIVQSPDGTWTNWSITRGMVADSRHLVCPVMPQQDIGTIRQLWTDIGKDMPYALAFGVPPASIMVSGMPLPKWTDESGFIGTLTGEGVVVTKCETNGLLVPADAGIGFEGHVSRSETAMEGPMGEYHGMTFPGHGHPQPLFHVEAITFRDDPILPLCVAGRAPEENHTVYGVMQSVELLAVCKNAGLPIKMAWCPFEAHVALFVLQVDRQGLIRLGTTPEAFCQMVGDTIFKDPKMGWYIPKLMIVGEDVDPTSLEDLMWAEATRCEPGKGGSEYFWYGLDTIPMVPYISNAKDSPRKTAKVIRCCMLPQEFTHSTLPWVQASFKGSFPSDLQEKVLS